MHSLLTTQTRLPARRNASALLLMALFLCLYVRLSVCLSVSVACRSFIKTTEGIEMVLSMEASIDLSYSVY